MLHLRHYVFWDDKKNAQTAFQSGLDVFVNYFLS